MQNDMDYKGALYSLDKAQLHSSRDDLGGIVRQYKMIEIEHLEVIQAALKIAHAVQSGEVSEGMLDVAYSNKHTHYQSGHTNCEIYRSMATQLMKEACDEG